MRGTWARGDGRGAWVAGGGRAFRADRDALWLRTTAVQVPQGSCTWDDIHKFEMEIQVRDHATACVARVRTLARGRGCVAANSCANARLRHVLRCSQNFINAQSRQPMAWNEVFSKPNATTEPNAAIEGTIIQV